MGKKKKKNWLEKKKKNQEQSLVVSDPLQAYINEVKQYRELTAEEEYTLAIKYWKEGDADAAYKLVTSNLMLVVRIVMKFKREFQNLLDLIQEGNTGLMQAVKKFDPAKGVRLPAYATWWIKAYILKYIMDNWRMVKVGTTNTRRKLLYNLQKEKDRLLAEGFSPTPKLLAAHFDVSPEEIVEVDKSLGASDVSLHSPAGDNEQSALIDILPEPEGKDEDDIIKTLFHSDLRKRILTFRSDLKKSDRDILENRIMSNNPATLQVIADRSGITREAVRQAEQRLFNKLKSFIKKEYPDLVKTGDRK
ncbi:MAG TPA: sigma-70 family RNA polymerase sigma factor [Nitrospinota bacterium]|nr:sigma-70 family RNA polymerase sigma factor [Nitrospinota bacterium]